MSATTTVQPSVTMTQERGKAAPGFFSVLLGRGTANLKTEPQPEAAKRPSTDARPAKPTRLESATLSAQEQERASFAAERGFVPPRSSMTADQVRPDVRREPRPRHTSGNEAFEAAVRRQAGALTERSNMYERQETQPRPQVSSMRQPKKDRFVDARDAFDEQDEAKVTLRPPRKVAFRTPTSSLHKGRGEPNLATAGSSSESFHAPPLKIRPIPKTSKPKHSRSASKAEIEERKHTSSTATSHNIEQLRPYPGKGRRANESIYPFASEPRRESFQAIRASGPDRVIIAPAFGGDSQPWPATKYSTMAVPTTRRPGPTPLAPHARTSQDLSRPKETPSRLLPSTSHRRTVSAAPEPSAAVRESSRSRSRVESNPSRPSMSSRPAPAPVAAEARSFSATRSRTGDRVPKVSTNGLHHASGTMSMGRERYSGALARA